MLRALRQNGDLPTSQLTERGYSANETSTQLVQPIRMIEKPEDGVQAHGAFLLTTWPDPRAHESHQQKLNSTYKKLASAQVPN
jgi:hypothetical protein